jgi:hypothetical protein
MKKLILIIFLIIFSCKEEISTVEKRIYYSSLNEPQNNIYIELLSYYPALNKSQSNLYIVKDIHNNDTLYVVDKDTLSVSDFIKNYNGIENTSLIIRRGEMKSKNEYLVNMPSSNAINNKKLYLGELIRLTD